MRGEPWFNPLAPLCKETCRAIGVSHPPDVLLFYLARWCQKETERSVPDLQSLGEAELRFAARKIARNLAADGARVERVAAGDRDALHELGRELLGTTAAMSDARAGDFADEARQKVAEVLLTGTRPSEAVEELRNGPEGPDNEYVFSSPFSFWARSVAKNLVFDDYRRTARDREGPAAPPRRRSRALDRDLLMQAHDALPDLLEAIRELPPTQRATMCASLARREVDELVRERLLELAPDLFSDLGQWCFSSDTEIAEYLGSTPRRVASNRSEARRKLVRGQPLWKLLLDFLMPHRSTGRRKARKGRTRGSRAPSRDRSTDAADA